MCLFHAGIVSKRLYLAQRRPSAYPSLHYKKICVSPKIRILFSGSGTFPQTLDFEKFGHRAFTVDDCHKQAIIISLLLTILGSSGCIQVLPSVDRRPLPVDHTQCFASSAAQLAMGHDIVCRAGSFADHPWCHPRNS